MRTKKQPDIEKQRAKPARRKGGVANKSTEITLTTDELIDLSQNEVNAGNPADVLVEEPREANNPIPNDARKEISAKQDEHLKQAEKKQAEWEQEHPFPPYYAVLGADNTSLSLTEMKSWKSRARWKIWQAALVLHGIDPQNVDLEYEIELERHDDWEVTFEWLIAQRIPETNAVCRTYTVLIQSVELESSPLKSPTGMEMVSTLKILAIAKEQKLGSRSVIKFLESSPNEEILTQVPLYPGEVTVSVTEAAKILMEENHGRFSMGTAKTRISRACDDGTIRSEGSGKSRRVSLETLKKHSAEVYDKFEKRR